MSVSAANFGYFKMPLKFAVDRRKLYLKNQEYLGYPLGWALVEFFANTREKPPVRLSPRLPRRRESKRHLFVVGSLDKHIQNKKELIRPRRLCLRRELPYSKAVQFCLECELPAPGTTGGLFFICVESTNLT